MNADTLYLRPILELHQNLFLLPKKSIDWSSIICDFLSFLTAMATIATAWIAYKALNYAKKEYELHKKAKEAETLSSYNQRYSTDIHIEKTIKFLMEELPVENFSLNDKEMFLRFFEELQFTIEQGGLSKETAYDMFAFYALEAAEKGDEFIPDYSSKEWGRFRLFVRDMQQIKKQGELKKQ